MLTLLKFRVTNFRSVIDSGWIDADDVTTLVGTNEAGKSNLLLALWKLKPAKDGAIDPLNDMPRHMYAADRANLGEIKFIHTEFALDDALIKQLVDLTKAKPDEVSVASVSRLYDGKYCIGFPRAVLSNGTAPKDDIIAVLSRAQTALAPIKEVGKGELGFKQKVVDALAFALQSVKTQPANVSVKTIQSIIDALPSKSSLKTSRIVGIVQSCATELRAATEAANRPNPTSVAEARKLVLSELPVFVYYSNYGNLDTEIYLPHVIENLKRTDLSTTAAAKARTLRVLFDFVSLKPQEILELGQMTVQNDQYGRPRELTPEETEVVKTKTKQRSILLESASLRLTSEFRKWWKQGDYRFDFQADGNHFRIWVSDDKRPAKVELEGRSTGLQWFLSFFLVFLVESQEAHKGAILLLDEAGLSLHPLGQEDLVEFFNELATKNQLIHTTHSPFLIHTDHMDRVRAVFVGDEGNTVSSSDLRLAAGRATEKDAARGKSIYPAHAALGLNISKTVLSGCLPVIVEGTSDQTYLSAIKLFLIREKRIAPGKEIVFVPSGGAKNMQTVSAILAAKEDAPPPVLLDADAAGLETKHRLVQGLYKTCPERIMTLDAFVDIPGAEIEDVLPRRFISDTAQRLFFRDVDERAFTDVVSEGTGFVSQAEAFAQAHDVNLPASWKPDLAARVKQILSQSTSSADVTDEVVAQWQKLFECLLAF